MPRNTGGWSGERLQEPASDIRSSLNGPVTYTGRASATRNMFAAQPRRIPEEGVKAGNIAIVKYLDDLQVNGEEKTWMLYCLACILDVHDGSATLQWYGTNDMDDDYPEQYDIHGKWSRALRNNRESKEDMTLDGIIGIIPAEWIKKTSQRDLEIIRINKRGSGTGEWLRSILIPLFETNSGDGVLESCEIFDGPDGAISSESGNEEED